MSRYLWPLGSNYNNEYMDTDDFLKNCRTVDKQGNYVNVKWRVQPGFVPFNYITNHYPLEGQSEQIEASGIYSEEGLALDPFFRGYYFSDEYMSVHAESRKRVFGGEGVRLTKLYYRINDSKWMELSPGLKFIDFNLTNNGDKIDIQATYQVWTMGNPHSPIPFMWLGDEGGVYNDGKNKFTDSVPINPGRKYSGMINYHKGKDYNASWKLKNVSWYAPGSTMLESNWAYQNSIFFKNEIYKKHGKYLDTWSEELNCQKFNEEFMDAPPGYWTFSWSSGWNYNYSRYNTYDTTSKWWKSPYKTRKGIWWVYEKTYTDSFVASDLYSYARKESVKDVSFKVLPMDRNWTRTKWLNGTKGQIVINFKGPYEAFVDIYAKQLVYSTEVETLLKSKVRITNYGDNKIDIRFTDYPELYRSKDIVYYIKIYSSDVNNKKCEYELSDISYLSLLKYGSHYYNDEPPWISNVQIKRIDSIDDMPKNFDKEIDYDYYWSENESINKEWIKNKELYQITWDIPKDPDNDTVDYTYITDKGNLSDIIFSPSENYTVEYGRQNDWTLRYRRGQEENSNENATLQEVQETNVRYDSQKEKLYSKGNFALYRIPSRRFIKDNKGNFIDPLNLWIIPHDGNNNNYYYGTRVNLLHVDKTPIVLEVLDNKNELNDAGKLKLFHGDYINATVDIKIHLFMSDKPHDKSTGKYLGTVYEGKLEPGYTTKTINVYSKISSNKRIKRGYYIKYAIECKNLDQDFDPYASDAWNLAEGYHLFNCLPTPVTPFICENRINLFEDKKAAIAWNESIDNDNEPVSYILYIAAVNKPEMNKYTDQFWINGDQDENYEKRKFCKKVDVGTTLPSKDFPYQLDLSEFEENDGIKIWITARDNTSSIRFLTGNTLDISNLSVRLYPPQIITTDARAIGLLGEDMIDGDSGYVKVCQVNNEAELATVTLHAICKKMSGPEKGDMKLFENIATWNLNSGEWSPDTKINFRVAFGKEWSNSEVRYFAVSTTVSGLSSYDSDEITTNAYDMWIDGHVYNEEPNVSIIRRNKQKSNLHKNAYIDWSYMIDERFTDKNSITIVDGAYNPVVPKLFY